MEAIIYTSNTGFTEQYALMLGEQTGMPVYTLKSAKGSVPAGAKVIYLGWLMASGIKGYKKAAKKYCICAVCAVGMSPDDAQRNDILKHTGITDTPLFVLQGGFDMDKLHGIYRFMMQTMRKTIGKGLEKKEAPKPEEAEMLEMFRHGADRVRPENLTEVLAWYRKQA
ncbi:MAG: hypothetical protein EOM14_07095 [Clostridia bacterium]|nr:hypothetical protein [Clostridia bacterium]